MSESGPVFSEQNRGLLCYGYALALKIKNNVKGAEKKFLEARKYHYDQASLSCQLFDLYLASRDLKSAAQELDLFRQALGDQPAVTLLEGCFLYDTGKIDDSLAAFEKIKDSLPEARLNIGRVHFNRGDYQKALDIWTDALASAPGNQNALALTGSAYLQLGDKVKAQECFDKSGIPVLPDQYYSRTILLSLGSVTGEAKFQFPCK